MGNPVLCITHHAAMEYCRWLSKKTRKYYRLPTEAEWEWACRAGTTTAYSFGDDAGQLGDYAWFEKNSDDVAHKVGKKKPNPWGLYDMLGNVWEWTGDWYGEDYYAHSPEKDPPGPEDANVKVRRGGAWNTFPLYARCSYRNWNSRTTRCINLGFRVVREE